MSRPLAAMATALLLLVTLETGASAADEVYRVVLSRIDASGFPTVRFVASVVDGGGRPARGVRPEELQVTEGKANPSANVRLASQASSVTLAIVIDTSGSMTGRPIADVKAAVGTMVRQLGPADRVAVIAFDTKPRLAQPFTADKAGVVAAINALSAAGDTALFDAVVAASDILDVADPRSRRAIVLLTDGTDTHSKASRGDAVARLAADGFPLYAIGLGTSIDRPTLDALSQATAGGATLLAPTPGQLADVYAGLSEQIRSEYAVEYASPAKASRGTTVGFEVALWRSGRIVARTTGTFVVPASGPAPAALDPAAPLIAPTSAAVIADDSARATLIVGLLGAATTLMFVLWLYDLGLGLGSGPARRLRLFVRGADVAPSEPERRRPAPPWFVPPLRAVARPLLRILPSRYVAAARHRLELAGEPIGEIEFIGLRFLAALACGAAALLALSLVSATLTQTALGLALGALVGYLAPAFVVDGTARARRKAIQRALVPSLDMLALSVEAGLAFDAAISQVVQRWRNPLSDELHRLLLEFQMGRDRKQALRELARRSGVADLAKFVNAVIQADTLGVGLAKTLQEQAVELRTKRRQRAEEQARIAPIKMMFPMVLLIFPALFVVILGPAVPRMLAIFSSVP